jgi:hypothetical protein
MKRRKRRGLCHEEAAFTIPLKGSSKQPLPKEFEV